jgi:hypothetical protein
MVEQDVMTGSCLCGAVRFEVDGQFERVSACHCTTCKRISGGGGTVTGRVRTENVRIVDGRDHIVVFEPSEGTAKSFCGTCGTNLFGTGWPDSEVTGVRLATLDEPYEGTPEMHIFVRSVAPWETLPEDGIPRHDAMPG